MTTHTLLICNTCAAIWKEGKLEGMSGGQLLFNTLSQLTKNWELSPHFHIQEVQCMSACSHACTLSFVAPGKYTYLLGDLPSDEEKITQDILEVARQYYHKPDGLLPWSERPESLKKAVIARIPPLNN